MRNTTADRLLDSLHHWQADRPNLEQHIDESVLEAHMSVLTSLYGAATTTDMDTHEHPWAETIGSTRV